MVGSHSLWHECLGTLQIKFHCSFQRILRLVVVLRIKDLDICFCAKWTHTYFVASNCQAKELSELIHCDICSVYKATSFCGARYFLTSVDDASHIVVVYLMRAKGKASMLLENFVVMVKTQFGKEVKTIKSDNRQEFLSGPMKRFYWDRGILHPTNYIYTLQQNGRVERKHRPILNVARAVHLQAHLPLNCWGEYALTTAYLINRTPSKVLNGKTPYEMLFYAKLSYVRIKMFGFLCYAHLKSKDRFASRTLVETGFLMSTF